jgi:release factor glutamine methyltransferase
MSLSVEQSLAQARALGLPRLEASALLAHVLQQSRTWLLAHGDALLTPEQQGRFGEACRARLQGVPLAYLVGQREFFGLMLDVTPDVLDPRPDTELLVDWALDLLKTSFGGAATPSVVDLGTGSGAVALAVKAHCPRAAVTAVEQSGTALRVAAGNAQRLGLAIEFVQGSWFEPLAQRSFDLVLSNPPYLGSSDPHLPALHAEPRAALVAGTDALADLRRIATDACTHLHAGGWLVLEHGADQGHEVARLMRLAGFVDVGTRRDLAGHARCTGGRLPGRPARV